MEVKDILTSLAQLEANLKDIESAKKQVEDTIASCSQIGQTAGQYSSALGGIAAAINKILSQLIEKKEFIKSEARDILKSFKTQCDITINTEKSVIQDISSSFEASCKDLVGSSKTELKRQTDNMDSILSAKYMALNALIGNLNTEITRIESLYGLINETLQNLTILRSDIIMQFEELSASQTKQDEDLNSIKNQIENLLNRVKTEVDSLQEKLIDSQEKQDNKLTRISTASAEANTNIKAISKEITELQAAVKINKFLIIASIISIIMTIVAIFAK